MEAPIIYEESAPITLIDYERMRAILRTYPPPFYVNFERRSTADNDGSWLRRREPK